MEHRIGVYVMQVAATLTDMHPQTLRKYERAGFLTPLRNRMLRRYSDEDIDRLRMIKHLVDKKGLNLAGVELALSLRGRILEMKKELSLASINPMLEKKITGLLDEILEMILSNGRKGGNTKWQR